MTAAQQCKAEVVAILVKAGATLDLQNKANIISYTDLIAQQCMIKTCHVLLLLVIL